MQTRPDDANDTSPESPGVYSSSPDLSLYVDSACTQDLTAIDWGTISPGESVVRTMYVKNTGNIAVVLSMYTMNWSPANANGPVAVSWDKEGVLLDVNRVLMVSLKLNVSLSISEITSFDMDIVISATG